MPDEKRPPDLPYADIEQEPFIMGEKEIASALALRLVVDTFNLNETFRSNNHDRRFSNADALYFGWLPQKFWDNTNVPRSSMGIPIVFDQIESALPAITQAIFGVTDEWFSCTAEPGASTAQAREVESYLSYVFEHPSSKYGSTVVNEVEAAIKQVLLYGNGGCYYYWDTERNLPGVRHVDIRDFYIDAGCTTPSVDDCRAIIWRREMTAAELAAMRNQPGFNIPDDDILNWMAKNRPIPYADKTKRLQEAFRGVVSYSPGLTDYPANPADRRIEVLIYYSKDRIVWVLNRVYVAYNETNIYGFIPFDFAPCYTVPGRWYAQSMADVQEGNQRIIEALYNARLDEINLSLHPPRVTKANSRMTPSQQRWRPGATYTAEDPTKDFALIQPKSDIANVFQDIQYLEILAEKRTGVNSVGMGVPRGGNVNRTAVGVQSQMSGSASRLATIVRNIENYLIVPMLYKVLAMTQLHSNVGQILPAYNRQRETVYISGESVQKPFSFRMSAASKMITRERVMQMFPFLAQYLISGPFISQLQKAGRTVDFEEMAKMLQDATGISRKYTIVRDLSPEEQKALQQPPPEVVADQQKTQMELQTRMQLQKMQSDSDMQLAMAKNQPNPMEMQNEAMKAQMEQQREQLRLYSEQMMQQIKLMAEKERMAIEREKAAMQLQIEKLKLQSHIEQSQVDSNLRQFEASQDARIKQAQSEQQMMLSRQTALHGAETQNMVSKMKPPAQTGKEPPRKKAATRDKKVE